MPLIITSLNTLGCSVRRLVYDDINRGKNKRQYLGFVPHAVRPVHNPYCSFSICEPIVHIFITEISKMFEIILLLCINPGNGPQDSDSLR